MLFRSGRPGKARKGLCLESNGLGWEVLVGNWRAEGAGDGFLECTLSHPSLSLAEQREEVGETRGPPPLWTPEAAPARGEGVDGEL